MTIKRITVLLFLFILFFGCTLPESPEESGTSGGDTPATTAFLCVNNNTTDDWNLKLGDWSDNLVSRITSVETGNLPGSGTVDFADLIPGDYDLWIRLGGSDFKLNDSAGLFSFVTGLVYELTLVTISGDMIWTLTDGSTTVLGTGLVTEYPDVPPVNPAQIHLTSNKTNFLKCHSGTWANEFGGRTLFSSSEYFSSYGSTDWELSSNPCHFWIEYGGLYYPLIKEGAFYEADLASNGDYAIAISDLTSWTLTDQLDGSTVDSGILSTEGYAKYLPDLGYLYPSEGSSDVYVTKTLSWNCSYGDSYDLYLDKVDGTTLATSGLAEKEYSPSLTCNTTYYWKVVARNNSGESESYVQSFTTEPPLIPVMVCDEVGGTNQHEITVEIKFNIPIYDESFTAEDLIISGGAVIDRFVKLPDGRYIVDLIMPDYDIDVTFSLPAGGVQDFSSPRRFNEEASIIFDYHHIPMGEITCLCFESDSSGVWALDYGLGQIVYVDPSQALALYAWDLPYDYPVDMEIMGNELFILYRDESKVSVFTVNGSNPEASSLNLGVYDLPLRSGNVFEEAYDMATDAAGSRLFISYRDSDWPNDNIICVLSPVDGSVLTFPVLVGGNANDGCFLDYGEEKLTVAELGVSNGQLDIYDTESGLSLPAMITSEMDNFLSRDGYDLNMTGTRAAIHCSNSDIVTTSSNNNYIIYDLVIDSEGFNYRGRWETGEYCINPQFSPDDSYLYILSRDNDKLMVWDGTDYTKVRDLAFPNSGDYGLYRVSPDGQSIIGFSYDNYNMDTFKFYSFDNIRD